MRIAKGEPGGECARIACEGIPAIGFNRSTGDWYCVPCSRKLNEASKDEAQRLYGGDLVIINPNG